MTASARHRVVRIAAMLLLGSICAAHAETRFIVTVDVESLDDLPLPTQATAKCTGGEPCGLEEIVQMLVRRGVRGTFFLNVYEYKTWGEESLRNIALQLQRSGQEVALHTHPQWLYDPGIPRMYDYSLQEQTRIIAEGVALIEKWTGEAVFSHRAGAYTANRDTLQALENNGIYLDSSLFYGHQLSMLNELSLARNLPSVVGRVIEVPVTVYERQEQPSFGTSIAPPFTSIRKFDPNWFVDEREAISAIDAAVAGELPYVVLFLHSFSLIQGSTPEGTLVANSRAKYIFSSMLDHVAASELAFVTMRELAADGLSGSGANDAVPAVGTTVPPYRYAWHLLRANVSWAASALSLGVVIVVALIVLTRRSKRPRLTG